MFAFVRFFAFPFWAHVCNTCASKRCLIRTRLWWSHGKGRGRGGRRGTGDGGGVGLRVPVVCHVCAVPCIGGGGYTRKCGVGARGHYCGVSGKGEGRGERGGGGVKGNTVLSYASLPP